MCATCGCSTDVHAHGHEHGHEHGHGHGHGHGDHDHEHDDDARLVKLERDVLAKNDRFAAENRAFLRGRRALALNLVSSPGAGKTALLERTLHDAPGLPVVVVEGDQETDRDAARIRAAGARVVQINTGSVCHLDAHRVGHALEELDPPERSVVMIENVGNLVCPALFDLGERAKVVLFSVTEGEDKPLKYPHMFRAAGLVVLSKVDLLPHLAFDVERALAYVAEVAPRTPVLRVSSTTGAGIPDWLAWLEGCR